MSAAASMLQAPCPTPPLRQPAAPVPYDPPCGPTEQRAHLTGYPVKPMAVLAERREAPRSIQLMVGSAMPIFTYCGAREGARWGEGLDGWAQGTTYTAGSPRRLQQSS